MIENGFLPLWDVWEEAPDVCGRSRSRVYLTNTNSRWGVGGASFGVGRRRRRSLVVPGLGWVAGWVAVASGRRMSRIWVVRGHLGE